MNNSRAFAFLSKHPSCILGMAALAYLALAIPRLRYPGLQYNEMLHVNAALGALTWQTGCTSAALKSRRIAFRADGNIRHTVWR
jgi:hypothetical protein